MADPVLHAGIAHGQAALTLLPALVRTQGPRYKKHRVHATYPHAETLPWMHLGDPCSLAHAWPANTQLCLYVLFLFPRPMPFSI